MHLPPNEHFRSFTRPSTQGHQLVLGRQTHQRLFPPMWGRRPSTTMGETYFTPCGVPPVALTQVDFINHSSHGGDDGNINSRDTLAFNSFLVVPNRNSTIWTELHRTHQPLDCCGFLVDSVLCLVTFVTLCHRARLFLSLAHLFLSYLIKRNSMWQFRRMTFWEFLKAASLVYIVYYVFRWGRWEITWWKTFFEKRFGRPEDKDVSVRDLYPD